MILSFTSSVKHNSIIFAERQGSLAAMEQGRRPQRNSGQVHPIVRCLYFLFFKLLEVSLPLFCPKSLFRPIRPPIPKLSGHPLCRRRHWCFDFYLVAGLCQIFLFFSLRVSFHCEPVSVMHYPVHHGICQGWIFKPGMPL